MADERRDDKQGRPERESGPGGEGRTPDEGRRRFGRRRPFKGRGNGTGGRHFGDNSGQPPRAEDKRELPSCPLCGKPVYDLSTALSANKEAGEPAHFDCVLERVAVAEGLSPQERLVYLGSGTLGVIEFKDKSESAFVVKRRIPWETESEKKEWRKNLSSRIANL